MPARPTAPAVAVAAGYSRLAFNDDFTSAASIDARHTGRAGFKWYPNGVHSWGMRDISASSWSIANSVLTINPTAADTNFNMQLSTCDPNTGAGTCFGHGYFEARIRFPIGRMIYTPEGAFAWPAFWSASRLLFENRVDGKGYGELDFFEASNDPRGFLGTVHEFRTFSKNSHVMNAGNNSVLDTGADYSQWHTFGCLWESGRCRWFLDGKLMLTQTWGARGVKPTVRDPAGNAYSRAFSILDAEPARGGMNVILGTGKGRPMSVDWVRIWTA